MPTLAPAGRPPQPAGGAPAWAAPRAWLLPTLRAVAPLWAGAFAVVGLVVAIVTWLLDLPIATDEHGPGFVVSDSRWYLWLAEHWYGPDPDRQFGSAHAAYLPAVPALIRVLTPLCGGHPVLAAQLLAGLSSLAAAVLLHRWAQTQGLASGRWAVAWLLFGPVGYVMFVPYSESLFLVVLLLTLMAVQAGRWLTAGVFTTIAVLTRVSGLSLLVALGVAVLLVLLNPATRLRGAALCRALAAPTLPLLAWLGWQFYLSTLFGGFGAQTEAMRHWNRAVASPLTGLTNTLVDVVAAPGYQRPYYAAELVSMGVAVAVCVLVWRQRWWPQTAFVVTATVMLASTNFYSSVQRLLLLLVPLWLWLGERTHGSRAAKTALVVVAVLSAARAIAPLSGSGWWGV